MVQQLEAREEGNLEIRETFSSLKEEVESKTKKLNKVHTTQPGRTPGPSVMLWLYPPQLRSKLRAAQEEIAEYEEEQRREREQLAIAAEELQKELSLR